MNDKRAGLFERFVRGGVERDVESELLFHLELLTEENLRRGMNLEKAEEAAIKQFGDFERIKNQCVEIGRRNHPLVRVLKTFLIVIFLGGVLTRIIGADIYSRQIGNLLITIAALSGLLVHLRGSHFSGFVSETNNSKPLGLVNRENQLDKNRDNSELTPLERVIGDK